MTGVARTAHRVLSIAVSLFWLLQILTGVVLVFHRSIDDRLIGARPEGIDFKKVDVALGRLQAAPATSNLASVVPSGGAVGQLDVLYRTAHGGLTAIRLDGSSGAVRRISAWTSPINQLAPLRLVFLLHKQLLAGEQGEFVVGLSGVLLVVNVVIGLKIAWPRPGQWRRMWDFGQVRAPLMRRRAMHRAVGLSLAPLLLVTALTGLEMIWRKPLQSMLSVSPEPAPKIAAAREASPFIPLSAAVAVAGGTFPKASFAGADLPSTARPFYTVRLRQPGELRQVFGSSLVDVDATNGGVLAARDGGRTPWQDGVIAAAYPLHVWEWGGVWTRWFALLIGAGALYQGWLGLNTWMSRQRNTD